ncbi:MAG TPA: hypothetical protein VIF81_10470 [Pyrinomonadaceae bacterium]|jgi:hypothetical protein
MTDREPSIEEMLQTQHKEVRDIWNSELTPRHREQLLEGIKRDYLSKQKPDKPQDDSPISETSKASPQSHLTPEDLARIDTFGEAEGGIVQPSAAPPETPKSKTDHSRSETMSTFLVSIARFRRALREVFGYLWQWLQLSVLVGAIIGLGAIAMTEGYYTPKEILYLVCVGLLVAKAIHDLRQRELRKQIAIILIASGALICGGLVGWTESKRYHDKVVRAPAPEVLHGVLIPANDSTPPLPEGCDIPSDSVVLFLGDSVGYSISGELPVIRIKGENIISFSRGAGGVFMNARVYSIANNVVAQVTDNEIFINPGNLFHPERPDWHTLRIKDNTGAELLFVRYVNRRTILIRGTFYTACGPILVNAKDMQFGGNSFGGMCMGEVQSMFDADQNCVIRLAPYQKS